MSSILASESGELQITFTEMLREENKIKTKKKERTKHRFEKGTCKPMLPGSTFNQTLGLFYSDSSGEFFQ